MCSWCCTAAEAADCDSRAAARRKAEPRRVVFERNEPLRTADEAVKRIDPDKLAEKLKQLDPLGDERCYASDEEYHEYAAAVLAALPDLMGGAK